MTRSYITLCSWNSSAPLSGNTISPDLCPPNSPVDYRICGLMQERVYIVQTTVRDTSRCDQRLETVPHWHMGKHITRRHRQSTWSMEKAVTCKHEAKGHHFEHLLHLNLLCSEPTHYTTSSFQSHQQSTEENTLLHVVFNFITTI